MRLLILVFYVVFIFLNIAFVKLGDPLPVRVIFALFIVVFSLMLVGRKPFKWLFFKNELPLLIILLGLLGFSATAFGLGGPLVGFAYIFKWVVQPLIILSASFLVCLIVGSRLTSYALLLPFVVSFIVAIFQGLHFDFSWDIKYYLDSFQSIDKEIKALDDIVFDGDGVFDDSARAKGLSWSPIHLSYHACLILGFFLYTKHLRFGFPELSNLMRVPLYSIVVLVVLYSGTRSALLGILMLMLYSYVASGKNPSIRLFSLIPLILVCAFIGTWVSEMLDMRIFQADDSSAAMRVPLYLFGGLLVLAKPWGYGWGDDSYNYAQEYWSIFRGFEGAESIFTVGLHNYVFNFLWVYGWFGTVILFFIIRYFSVRYGWGFFVVLIPYLVNSFFHNGGFLMGGNFIWLFVGVMIAVKYLEETRRV